MTPKSGNDKKDCNFEDELPEFFRRDSKIISPATVPSLTTASSGSASTKVRPSQKMHEEKMGIMSRYLDKGDTLATLRQFSTSIKQARTDSESASVFQFISFLCVFLSVYGITLLHNFYTYIRTYNFI